MRKFIKIIIFLMVFLSLSIFTVYAEEIKVIIDNNEKEFSVQPIMYNDRVMLPLRETFEAFGAYVSWNDETSEATAVKNDITVKIKSGSNELLVNDTTINMDCSVLEKEELLFLPVRYIAEAFGYSVFWQEEKNTVELQSLPDYECYEIENEKIPKYTSVISDAKYIEEKLDICDNNSYAYATGYDAVTEYIMTLQNQYGYNYYTTKFNDDGTVCYVYQNSKTSGVALITCANIEKYNYVVIINPSVYGNTTLDSSLNNEENANQAENSDEEIEYYDNTNNTLPTYSYVTGVELSEVVEEGKTLIYKYKDSFSGAAQYETAISMFCGYTEYSTDVDFGTFTTYYVNNDIVVGIVNSMFTNEVWIVISKS